MSMPTLQRRWTVADLDDLPDDGNRYEVIDGELFVTPAPSFRHQEAVVALHRLLADYLSREHVGHAFVAPADIVFSERRAVQPDVFVVPLVNERRPEHFNDVRRLLLAAEVLSPKTARADRVAKRTLFRDEGVNEYWVIDLDARTFERSIPDDPRVEVMAERLVWHPAAAREPLELDLTGYFARVLND
jgi:Uma2 family endonuclease